MAQPSTEWREEVAPDEAERFERYSTQLVQMQKKVSARVGKGRALHRKQVLALRAQLDVLPSPLDAAKHGLFAKPGIYEARVRLSNGNMNQQSDRTPDIRGFALKVLGVDGEGALGNGQAKSQDFLFINQEVFAFSKAEHFFEFVLAASKGILPLVLHCVKTYGLAKGLARLKALDAGQKKPFSGFLTETLFTTTPLACGPYAVKARLVPSAKKLADTNPDWAEDVRAHLAKGVVTLEFQLQFFVNEATTPLEDASVLWPESESPYVTVARLTLPQQDLASAPAQQLAQAAENGTFDPWNALMAHRPLGNVMRARKVAYFASERERGAV